MKQLYRVFRIGTCILISSVLIIESVVYATDSIQEEDEKFAEQTYLSAIGAPELWEKFSREGKSPGEGVIVAVLDTGVSLSDDLRDRLWMNEAEQNGEDDIDDDGNGYIDDIYGLSLTKDQPTTDTNGHGTMMAGIIAMSRGDGGGVGIAYGVRIMSVKISKTRNFGIDDLIEGINYAVDNGADVISMSLGTIYPTKDLCEAVQRASKKCILVASAGNEKRYGTNDIYQSCVYPAAYPEVIGVMSTDDDRNMSDFTNWCSAKEQIYDIAAPGEQILSTYLKGTYKAESGTSQAAAEIAATAAVICSMFPDREKYPADTLKNMLLGCMKKRTVFDETYGGTHRWLYLPDLYNLVLEELETRKTVSEETVVTGTTSKEKQSSELTSMKTQPTEAVEVVEKTEITEPTTASKIKPAVKVKQGKTYIAGKGRSKGKYIVKSTVKRTVYYKKCLVGKKANSAVIPKTVTLNDGKKYMVTGVTSKAFSKRKKVKKLTIKTKKLKKSDIKNILRSSRVRVLKIRIGTNKENKKYKSRYLSYFRKCGDKLNMIKTI